MISAISFSIQRIIVNYSEDFQWIVIIIIDNDKSKSVMPSEILFHSHTYDGNYSIQR